MWAHLEEKLQALTPISVFLQRPQVSGWKWQQLAIGCGMLQDDEQ